MVYDLFILDEGTGTIIGVNYYLPTVPSLYIEILAQSFSKTEFIIAINISSGLGFDLWIQSIQMWWNGTIVPSDSIIDLGNGLYNVSLTPIFVGPGEDPIIFNMTIISPIHWKNYFELKIAIDPKGVTPIITPPSGGDDGGGGGKKEETAIPGYNILIIIGVIGTLLIIFIKKGEKLEK